MPLSTITMAMLNAHELPSEEEQQEEPIFSVEKGWKSVQLIQVHGVWMGGKSFKGALTCREHFLARKDDIMQITTPKSGTTWLKALTFSVVNRSHHDLHNHPLLTTAPQDLVPFLEYDLYANEEIPNLTNLPSPRLFASHIPYQLLPTSIIENSCRIIYLCRNPKDTFVSMWHFMNNLLPEGETPVHIEEAFKLFCEGFSLWGPFWEHVLGYWKASLERPERVLFIKYEELKKEPTFHLRRLAEFLGCPFSEDEEKEEVVEKISSLCSFDSLKSLEVNKSGKTRLGPEAKNFFRRGAVGDWKSHLTAEMIQRMDKLIQEKLGDSGLEFNES